MSFSNILGWSERRFIAIFRMWLSIKGSSKHLSSSFFKKVHFFSDSRRTQKKFFNELWVLLEQKMLD